uniref:G_PROTEIN_RECEP_F1_2 domain-containing protein n=1 Tax=Angiostrongylus cantonensis TaxID=6313 RepID=A0A158P8V8_ANGCA
MHFQFAIWPGITILCQDEILPEMTRWHVHIYLDFTWWAMVYHYTMVAWSRWAAIQWPNWFRVLPPTNCLMICFIPWLVGLTQSIIEHQFDWFVPLYFNPQRYGMDTDWLRYEESGTNTYYMGCNAVLMVLPFPFYAAALNILLRRRADRITKRMSIPETRSQFSSGKRNSILSIQRQLSIETRLLIPCIINTIFFIVGQRSSTLGQVSAAVAYPSDPCLLSRRIDSNRVVFIAQCSKHGKWMNWAVMVAFTANSFVNPLLYLFFRQEH